MHGRDGRWTDEMVGAALAAAVAEDRALRAAVALAAAVAAGPCETASVPFQGSDTGFWGRAAMAHHAAVPLGLLRRA